MTIQFQDTHIKPENFNPPVDIKEYNLTETDLKTYFSMALLFFGLPKAVYRIPRQITKNKHTISSTSDGHLIIHLKRKMANGKGLLGIGTYKKVYHALRYDGERLTPMADITIFNNIEGVSRENAIAVALQNSGAKHTVEPGAYLNKYISSSLTHRNQRRLSMLTPLYNFNMDEATLKTTSFQAKLEMIHGTALGIAELHNLGIVHRDLKLQNILVKIIKINNKTHYVAKVADFGWAISEKNLVNNDKVVGNCGHRAPEVYFPQKDCWAAKNQTKEADIWALGIIFQQLYFKHPIKEFPAFVYNMRYMTLITQANIDAYLKELPQRDLEDNDLKPIIKIMAKCLKHNPSDRITADQAVAKLNKIKVQRDRETEQNRN